MTEEKILERYKFIAQHIINEKLAGLLYPEDIDVRINTYLNPVCDEVAIQIRALIYGEKLDTKLVEYPADWWQAFKAQYFPRWALKRWPVKNKVIRFEIDAIYPNVSFPKLHRGGYRIAKREDE